MAAATGDEPAAATYAYDETTRVNGIPLFGPRCNYGEHVHVGAAAAPGDLVTWLRDSEGDYEVTAARSTSPPSSSPRPWTRAWRDAAPGRCGSCSS